MIYIARGVGYYPPPQEDQKTIATTLSEVHCQSAMQQLSLSLTAMTVTEPFPNTDSR